MTGKMAAELLREISESDYLPHGVCAETCLRCKVEKFLAEANHG